MDLLLRPRRIGGASSFYRGAQLPSGVTLTGLSLATPFAGTTFNTTDLAIGHARYNAATTLTVSSTGSAGRTELLAHLATHAAGSTDHKIITPAATLSGFQDQLPSTWDGTSTFSSRRSRRPPQA